MRSANAAANSGVVGGDEDGVPSAASCRSSAASASLCAAVHPARRLVEADRGGPLAVEHEVEREPLALAAREVARMAVGEPGQPGGLERGAGSSSATRSCSA